MTGNVVKSLDFTQFLSDQQVFHSVEEGGGIYLVSMPSYLSLGIRLLMPPVAKSAVKEALEKALLVCLDDKEYQVFCVEAGLPATDRELGDQFAPLEVGLERAIAGNMGCYTGPEVIARQKTYDKVTRRLCGLELDNAFEDGARLWFEGHPVGRITSLINSPTLGPIVLIIIKRPYDLSGNEIKVGERETPKGKARIVSIPFKK